MAVRYDLGSNDSIEEAVKAVVAKWGRIDVFVANAVQWQEDYTLFLQAPVDKWQPVVRNNIVRPFVLCASCKLHDEVASLSLT
jgi:NAD(P)-dependent dehydrogenase (short-subunit alcohol dehydrogenase family)